MRQRLSHLAFLPILSLLALGAAAQTPAPGPEPVPAPSPEQETPEAAKTPFRSLTPQQAYTAALKEKKLSVLIFLHPGEDASRKLEANALKNPAILEWFKTKSVAVVLYADKDKDIIQRRGVARFPAIEVRAADRRILDTIMGEQTPSDLLALLEAAKRSESANEKPTGTAATDPLSWMAYGNNLQGRGGDPMEVADAYFWCLEEGDKHDPGFLEQNLDFLVRRLVYLKKFNSDIETKIRLRRDALYRKIMQGKCEAFEAYKLSVIDKYLRDIDDPIRAFRGLKGPEDNKPTLQKVILWNNLESIVAYRHYTDVLECIPDPKLAMSARIVAIELAKHGATPELREDMPRPPGVEKTPEAGKEKPALPKVAPEPKLPGVILEPEDMAYDAALLFECLVALKRDKEANELMELVTDYFPTARSYGYFIERANRIEHYDLAIAIAERGYTKVDVSEVPRVEAFLRRGLRKR